MAQNIKYRMTLGDKISGKSDPLVLIQGESCIFSDNSNSYILTLLGIKMNRKIYQPNEIDAELDIMQVKDGEAPIASETKAPAFKDISALLLKRMVKLDVIEQIDLFDGVETVGSTTIAENYFVFEVNPQLKRDINGIKMYVKLNIFSSDKLMTLTKYSKAYVNKKLGSSILQVENRNFGMTHDKKEPLIPVNIKHMQMLRYKNNISYSGKNVVIPSEYIQPYLVQYNETFYDFLVRTSHRCGEFLFFENGYLTLGLPDPEVNKDTKPFEIEEYEAVTLQDAMPGTIEVGTFARDSMKDSATDVGPLNHTEISTDASGFPTDIFPQRTSSNAELAHDEYFFPLFKDKFTTLNHQLHFEEDAGKSEQTKWSVIPFVKNLLSNPMSIGVLGNIGVWGFVASPILTYGIPAFALGAFVLRSVKNGNIAAHITPYENNIEQCKGEKVVHFGTADPSGWTTLNYYQNVRQYEEDVLKKTICIDMGTAFVDVKLGQRIKVSGLDDTYIVIQIEQTSEEKWDRHYDKYNAQGSDMLEGARSQKIYAVPAVLDKNNQLSYYPPLQPIPVIRKVGPQTAFVTNNADPKFQGRVRVAYPWQSMNFDVDNNLKENASKLKLEEEELSELKKNKWKLTRHIVNLESFIAKLKDFCKSSKEAQELKLDEIDRKLQVINEKIQSKEKEIKEKTAILQTLKEKEKKEEIAISQNPSAPRTITRNEVIRKYILEFELEKLNQERTELEVELKDTKQLKEDLLKAAEAYKKGRKTNPNYNLETDNPVIKQYLDDLENSRAQSKGMPKQEKIAEEKVESRKKVVEDAKDKKIQLINSIASPWVRVATPMASSKGGTYFKPIIGDEVLINYDNDNVERPYVVGSLFSKNHLVPEEQLYRFQTPSALTAQDVAMTIQSHNGHHITFTDPAAGWPFIFEAISPGASDLVRGTFASMPAGESFKDMGGGIHIGDRFGIYELELNSSRRRIYISSPFGSVELNAFTGINLYAPNGDVKITGKNVTIEAGNKVSITSGNNIMDPGMGDGADFGTVIMDQAVRGGLIAELFKAIPAKVFDMKIIRYVTETFLKPVDGTLTMKSKRYLKLEAGHGKATIQRDRYNHFKKSDGDGEEQVAFYGSLVGLIDKLLSFVNEYFQALDIYIIEAKQKRDTYKKSTKILKKGADLEFGRRSFEVAKKKNNSEDITDSLITRKDLNNKLNPFSKEGEVNELLDNSNDYIESAGDFERFLAFFPSFIINKIEEVNKEEGNRKIKILYDAEIIRAFYSKKMKSADWRDVDAFFSGKASSANVFFAEANRTLLKRQVIVSFLIAVSKSQEYEKYFHNRLLDEDMTDEKLGTDYWWHQLVSKIDRRGSLQGFKSRAWYDVTAGTMWNTWKEAVSSKNEENGYREWHWADGKGGQILMSDEFDKVYNFEKGQIKENDTNQGTMDYLKYRLWSIK